ncbi:unnamed protein product [Musa acuminata subsp. burmannicoides]
MSNTGMFLRDNSGSIIFSLCMIVCVLYCLICSRCRRHRNRADRPPQAALAMSAGGAATRDELLDAGLSQLAIDALPAFAHHVECKDTCPTTHCAVCLNPVMEGEMVRLLPGCRHAFHVECIDMWLHSHSLCPLCRAEAKPPAPAEKVELRRDPGPQPLPMV